MSRKVNKFKNSQIDCFQRLNGVINYADSEYDIFKSIICIFVVVVYKISEQIGRIHNEPRDLLPNVIIGKQVC